MTAPSSSQPARPSQRTPRRTVVVAQVLGWWLVPVLAAVAPLLSTGPAELPPPWLAVGAATLISMRQRAWQVTAVLALLMSGGAGLVGALGAARLPALPVLLLMGLTASLQARCSARLIHRNWRDIARDPRPLRLRRLASSAHFVLVCVLPWAALAGLAMAGIEASSARFGTSAWPLASPPGALELLRHAVLYASASGLSTLLLATLLNWDHWRLPPWPLAGGLGLCCLALGSGVVAVPQALYAAPLLAVIAGYLGGFWMAGTSVALMAASLMLALQHHELTPFAGSTGFVLLLLLVWRLAGIAFLASIWSDRRLVLRSRSTARHVTPSGAQIFRHVAELEQHRLPSSASPVDLTWLHIDLRPECSRGAVSVLAARDAGPAPAQGPAPDDAAADSGQTLASSRLPALMMWLAQTLRSGDAVAPLGAEALVVVLQDVDRRHLSTVIDRINHGLLRESHRHGAPAGLLVRVKP